MLWILSVTQKKLIFMLQFKILIFMKRTPQKYNTNVCKLHNASCSNDKGILIVNDYTYYELPLIKELRNRL